MLNVKRLEGLCDKAEKYFMINCLLSVDLDLCQFCGNSILLLGELTLVFGASVTGSPVHICICRDECPAVRLKVSCIGLPLASLPWQSHRFCGGDKWCLALGHWQWILGVLWVGAPIRLVRLRSEEFRDHISALGS